jgi:hypothetical protein
MGLGWDEMGPDGTMRIFFLHEFALFGCSCFCGLTFLESVFAEDVIKKHGKTMV